MDPLFTLGLEISRWLQGNLAGLDGFFELISNLGIEEFYLAFLPLIYWCVHKRVGKELAFIFLLSTGVNGLLKDSFRGPRPFWLDPGLQKWEETGFGVPSNHVQNATIIYFFLAAEIRKRWFWILAVVMVFLMAVSRIYLAAHFLHDVVAGLLVAVIILSVYFFARRRWRAEFQQRILGQRLLAMMLIPLLLVLIYLPVQLLLGSPDIAPGLTWADRVPPAVREGQELFVTAVATLLGFGIGVMMEGSRVRFRVEGPLWMRGVRFLLGILVTVGIWAGIRQITPEEPLYISLMFRFVRYTLLTLWISWYAPALFVRLGLAEAEPEPKLNISLRQASAE